MPNKTTKTTRQLSQQDRNELVAEYTRIERQSILPPPEEMAQYEKLRPGITDIMLTAFQEQSHHRMEIEKEVIKSGINNSKRGQFFAFILALITIIGGFTLIFTGKDAIGIASIITSLSSLVGVFIYGNKSKKSERLEKSRQNK